MLLLPSVFLAISVARFAYCVPMQPQYRSDKGKSIAVEHGQSSQWEQPIPTGQVFSEFQKHQIWNMQHPIGDSYIHPSHTSYQQSSSPEWNRHGYVSPQPMMWSQHDRGQQNYQGNFDRNPQMNSDKEGNRHEPDYEAQQHMLTVAEPKRDITQNQLNSLLNNLFGQTESSPEHSQNSDHDDQDQTNHDVDEEEEEEEEGGEENTTSKAKHEERPRQNRSLRYYNAPEAVRFRKIWTEMGLSTAMTPKELAKRVTMLRLQTDLGTREIGKRAAQRVNEEKSTHSQEDQTYISEYLQYVQHINMRVNKVKKEWRNRIDLQGDELELAAINQAFHLLDIRDANRESRFKQGNHRQSNNRMEKPSRQRQIDSLNAEMNTVATELIKHLHSSNLDINTIDPAIVASKTMQLHIPGMRPSDIKRNVKKYLEQIGVDQSNLDRFSSACRLGYARKYAQSDRKIKKAVKEVMQLDDDDVGGSDT